MFSFIVFQYGTTNLLSQYFAKSGYFIHFRIGNDQVTFSTVKRSWLTKNPEAFLNLMRLYFIEHEHNKITTHGLKTNIKMLFPLSIPSLFQCLVDESVESVELFGQTVAYLWLLRFYIVVWIGNIWCDFPRRNVDRASISYVWPRACHATLIKKHRPPKREMRRNN